MPKQSGKSPVANKLNKSLAAHANDETTFGAELGALPPGIVGGIARLADAKLGTYKEGNNKGERFIYLAGVVVEPKGRIATLRKAFVDGKPQVINKQEVVEGLRTSILLPLCDTKTSTGKETSSDENVDNALNELRKLGGDKCTSEVTDEESLQAVLDVLKEQKPYFRFSTSGSEVTKDRPTERVWENWRGNKGLEDYMPESGSTDTEDDTGDEEEEEEEMNPEGDELADLGAQADEGDEDAQRELEARAKKAKISSKKVQGADSWVAVAEMIAEVEQPDEEEEEEEEEPEEEEEEEADEEESEDEEEEEEEEEPEEEEEEEKEWEPSKEEVYKYKPPKAKKAVEVEVTAVFKKAQTVNLLNCDDRKTKYEKVSWDKLESAE